jgi:hypothetical protein
MHGGRAVLQAGPALLFIVIGGARETKMPARQCFAWEGHCYFLAEYNGERLECTLECIP